jgi:hypothetical protein
MPDSRSDERNPRPDQGIWIDRNLNVVDPPYEGGPLVTVSRPTQGNARANHESTRKNEGVVPFSVREGTVALWHGARERGETGLEATSGVCAFLMWEVTALPDFSSSRFPDLANLEAAQRVQVVSEAQSQFLARLHALGRHIGVSLRYLCTKSKTGDPTIRLFLVVRVLRRTEAEARQEVDVVLETVESNFPYYYPLQRITVADPITQQVVFPSDVQGFCEVLKVEQWEEAWHNPEITGFRFWYGVENFPVNGANDMVAFCRSLVRTRGTSLVDITLTPANPLTTTEKDELSTWRHLADSYSRERKETVRSPSGLFSKEESTTIEIAADPKADKFKELYEGLAQQYDQSAARLFHYSVRVLALENLVDASDVTVDASLVAGNLTAQALSPGSPCVFVPLSMDSSEGQKALRSVHFCYTTPAVCHRNWRLPDAPETLRRLHRMVYVGEIAPFFRLPIPGKEGCLGFAVDNGFTQPNPTTVSSAPTSIQIGQFYAEGRLQNEWAGIRLQDLSKHALIVGVPGSGKTSLSFSLLVQLWRDHKIPWMVLEPAKNEYRGLLEVAGVGEDTLVFTVGNERYSPLRLNPLEILEGVGVDEHIASVAACLQGAFSLPDPLPMLLDEALRDIYADRGWSMFGIGGDDPALEPPTLQDLYHKAVEVAGRTKYQGEVGANIRAALETRLGSLLRGPKGRCFGARRSVPMDILLTRPVVLELESLSPEERSLTMMILLTYVREYAKTTRRSGASLSHVCLVEEAHNLLGSGDVQGNREVANPKSLAIRKFVEMLAEVRALGEGLIIADQLPTALAPEAIKNTNIKIMHRLVAMDDREVLGKTMLLTEGQLEQAAALRPGMSYVYQEGWPLPRLVQEPDIKAELGIDVPPENNVVQERMASFVEMSPEVQDAYLPYNSCKEICRRCDSLIRERRERWAERQLPLIREAIEKDADTEPEVTAWMEYSEGLEIPDTAIIENSCASVHFIEKVLPHVLQGSPVR